MDHEQDQSNQQCWKDCVDYELSDSEQKFIDPFENNQELQVTDEKNIEDPFSASRICDLAEGASSSGMKEEIRKEPQPNTSLRNTDPEIEILQTNKGCPLLVKGGYSYHLNKKHEEVHYWSCVKKRSKQQQNRCYATIITVLANGKHIAEKESHHNHQPNPFTVQCRQLRTDLKHRSESFREVPSSTIRECAKNVSSELQTMISKEAQRKICQRSRKTTEYPAPPNVFTEIPKNLKKKTLDGEDLLATVDMLGGNILIFTTHDNVRRLSIAKMWMLDGTFSTAPTGFKQIYSILGCVGAGNTSRYLPLAFMLLPNKTEETYTRALEELANIAEVLGVDLDPEVALTDFACSYQCHWDMVSRLPPSRMLFSP